MAEAEAKEKDGIEEMQKNVEELKNVEGTVKSAENDNDAGSEDEHTPTELKAMEKGWSPNKEDLPEGKEWVGAGEYLRNEKFFAEIKKLRRETNSTKQAFEVLKEHHKKVQTAERDKLLKQLKAQKKVALEDADHDAVVEIDDQIADVKALPDEDEAVTASAADDALFVDWVADNPWYEDDLDMKETADDIGKSYYMKSNMKATADEIYDHVTKRIKKIYPEHFKPKPRSKPAVEGAGASRGSKSKAKSKFSAKDLSDEQRQVMRTFVKSGALTEEEYIRDLVEIGELK